MPPQTLRLHHIYKQYKRRDDVSITEWPTIWGKQALTRTQHSQPHTKSPQVIRGEPARCTLPQIATIILTSPMNQPHPSPHTQTRTSSAELCCGECFRLGVPAAVAECGVRHFGVIMTTMRQFRLLPHAHFTLRNEIQRIPGCNHNNTLEFRGKCCQQCRHANCNLNLKTFYIKNIRTVAFFVNEGAHSVACKLHRAQKRHRDGIPADLRRYNRVLPLYIMNHHIKECNQGWKRPRNDMRPQSVESAMPATIPLTCDGDRSLVGSCEPCLSFKRSFTNQC